ncbi:hypothetical protein EDD11_005800 [Mortierella claussenii]|nr:hypothetical protein EDD11_005800 [Mortierella claussenii]
MTDTANQELPDDDSAETSCPYPPCKYSKNKNAMRKHIFSHHKEVMETVGSFQAHAVPDFKENKAGLIEVERPSEDENYGAAASALLKKLSVTVGDESFSFSVSSIDAEKAPVSEDHLPLSQSTARSGQFFGVLYLGPASPGLLSNLSKRLNTSTELLITRCENQSVSIGINLNLSTRDLGIRGVPEIEPQQDLSSLVADLTYERMLSRSKWIEFPRCQRLPEDWDNIISGCWLEKPLLNYATAVLFVGCVLYNPQNKKAVLCLVAESYGRGRDVDVHAEKPICIGEGVSSISQPSTSGLYPHATVRHVQHDKKDHCLVLGCKIFNVLCTEVWRLDKDCSSERAFTAGSCSSAFPLVGNEEVRIFIDERSFNLASDVASGKNVPRFQIDYLRQIRSHLCSAHSYRMGRASCPLLWNMVSAQPATIFSLSMVRSGSGDGPLVSSLLNRMAKDVNLNGRNAVL